RLHPLNGHQVDSPTLPLTRGIRLPGPPIDHSTTISTTQSGAAGLRVRRTGAAPVRVFSQSTIHGAWDVHPHGPAAFDQQTRRFVNGSGPAINNDMLIRGRSSSIPANNARDLTSIPISNLGAHAGAMRNSNSLLPSAQPIENAAGVRAFQQRQMPDFRQERLLRREQRMENARARRQMEERNRISNRSQQGVNSSSAAGHPSAGVGRSQGQSMGRSSGQSGGEMRGGGIGGGMRSAGSMGGGNSSSVGGGGGMQSGGGGQHGPPRR
ncbi:MAG TPA: hypothetical protein VGW37_18830, partial [Terriglobia bacterium]|nr:hypothetical protein [Terriglobia bacterium]